jgi:hypothetical protein
MELIEETSAKQRILTDLPRFFLGVSVDEDSSLEQVAGAGYIRQLQPLKNRFSSPCRWRFGFLSTNAKENSIVEESFSSCQ